MEQVKAGAAFDEEGESINQVEKVLSNYDIKLRDTNNSFRNMSDVMSDVAKKYKELGEAGNTVGQQQITTAIAGLRQANMLSALLSNWDQVTKAQEIAANSAGLATERYNIYLDSIEAKSNEFKASWQAMWSATISSDTIKDVVEFGTKILDLITQLGGLQEIFKVIIPLVIGYMIAVKGIPAIRMTGFIGDLLTTIKLLPSATSLTEAFALANKNAAVSTAAWAAAIYALIEAFKAMKEYEDIWKSGLENVQATAATNLSGKTNTSDVVSTGVNMMTAVNNNEEASKNDTVKFLAQVKIFQEVSKSLQETTNSYAEYKAALDEVAKAAGFLIDEEGNYYGIIDNKTKSIQVLTEEEYKEANATKSQTYYHLTAKDATDAHAKAVKALSDAEKKVLIDTEKLKNATESLAKATEEQNKNGEISNQTAMALVATNAELLQFLVQTATGYKLDTEAAIKYIQAQISEKLTSLGLTEALKLVTAGHFAAAIAAVTNSSASDEEKASAIALIQTYEQLANSMTAGADATNAASGATSQLSSKQQAYNDLLKDTIAMLKQEAETQKENLQNQIDRYKKLIDKRKELLEQQKKEDEYNDKVSDKNKEISNIDNELLQIQFDNSEEANAKRLELESERADKVEELADIQNDYSIQSQEDALDKSYEDYKDALDKKIAALDRYLENTGAITQEAMALIAAGSEQFYDQLTKWNSKYGDGIEATTKKLWDEYYALQTVAGVTGGGTVSGTGTTTIGTNTGGASSGGYHPYSKGGAGIVPDGYPNDSATLNVESGEAFIILNKQQQNQLSMNNLTSLLKTPSFSSNANNSSSFSVGDIVVQVSGSLDKTVLPDLKSAVFEVLNQSMNIRGIKRNATSYSV